MPLTTTATWPTLTEGRKAKASEVEAKFDWLEGSQWPMTGGNMTTGVYDLGTSTAKWRAGYFNNVVANNLLTSATLTAAQLRTTIKCFGFVYSGASITAADVYNISSVSLVATGVYQVNWTTPFANNTYAVAVNPIGTIALIGTIDNMTTTSVKVYTFTQDGVAASTHFDLWATGDQ